MSMVKVCDSCGKTLKTMEGMTVGSAREIMASHHFCDWACIAKFYTEGRA